MNSIEEQLWSYIDGTCTAEERAHISQQLAHNPEYQQLYQELMQLHSEFGTLELDEPPMAFTYNVMEQIRTQEASVPLKAAINKRIIWGIAAFFILTISVVLIVGLRDINWASSSSTSALKVPAQLNVAKVTGFFSGPWMKGFLFFDVVLGLFLLDGYLRKRTQDKQEGAH